MNHIIKWIIGIITNALCAFVIFQNALMLYLQSKGVSILVAYKDVTEGLQLSQVNAQFFILNILLAVVSISFINMWLVRALKKDEVMNENPPSKA